MKKKTMRKVMGGAVTFLVIVMVGSFVIAGTGGFAAAEKDPTEIDSTSTQGPGTKIPPKITMTVPAGERNRKFAVLFPHAKHKGIDCTVCHHNAYETLAMCSCSVEGCHHNTRKRTGVESFFAAFHSTYEASDRSCIDCHKTRQKGPTACPDCHLNKTRTKRKINLR